MPGWGAHVPEGQLQLIFFNHFLRLILSSLFQYSFIIISIWFSLNNSKNILLLIMPHADLLIMY